MGTFWGELTHAQDRSHFDLAYVLEKAKESVSLED